ncbi:hypothetical protein NIES2100_68030 [Calothrix sp. NIES-2100]|uniref:hypothetical protein n=1 Tax=Calothrix sp. NIES-2100 TaxID=1954172 RepID=UPI000B5EE337|nr:hypothetical protein NIES2100_68030 [Calothrix sp. NIES-2100]
MEIYIKSRGLQRDYYWVTKSENQPIAENSESIPTQAITLINAATHLVEEKDFSLVLFRSQNDKLLLLVTALQTQRQDIQGRNIRNSIAWIGKNKEEFKLRQLAVLALKNELEQKIDPAINNYSGGFEVDWEAIEQTIQELIPLSGAGKEPLPAEAEIKKIARISETRKRQLADELLKYCLPSEKTGALVVVTGIKSKESLEKAQVWRSLSSDTSIPEQRLQPLNQQTNDWYRENYSRKPKFKKRNRKSVKLASPKWRLTIILIILAGGYAFLKYLIKI